MHGRGLSRFILALSVALVAILGSVAPAGATGDAPPATQPEAEPVGERTADTSTEPDPNRPVPTVSDFYPEDNNLSDCLGLVERPGCGSEARGGWRQTAVFGAIIAGFAVIIWRISVAARRSRSEPPADRRAPGPDQSRV